MYYVGGEVEVDMEWWHYLIVGAGLLIAVLVIIALILIVVSESPLTLSSNGIVVCS